MELINKEYIERAQFLHAYFCTLCMFKQNLTGFCEIPVRRIGEIDIPTLNLDHRALICDLGQEAEAVTFTPSLKVIPTQSLTVCPANEQNNLAIL